MNANGLLAIYDRVADAPDATTRLRQFVLDLAVRGKLVEQNSQHEPASKLLKRIDEQKRRLVTNGKFNTLNRDFLRDDEGTAFPIPANWTWCHLDDIAAVARGGSPRPIKSYLTDDPKGIPWIKIGDATRGSIYINGTKERIRLAGLAKSRLVLPGDLLLSNSMSFGYPYVTNIKGCIHDGWLVIRTPETLLDKLYLHTVLLSGHAKTTFADMATGAVVRNLNADKARMLPVPLPPLAEQHCIVAKVNELMTLCDHLDEARTARKEKCDQLTKTTLTRLSKPDADAATFRSHARFAIEVLPTLTARTNQVKLFRHAILDLAMRGKLAKQDPADEPVSELLRRIEVEKTVGSNTKKRKSYPLNAEPVDGKLFDLPTGWKWVPLARISVITMGQSPPGETYNQSGDGIPLINGPVEFTPGPFGRTIVNQFTTAPRKYCEEGDLLICVRGSTTGRTNVASFRACIGRGVASIRSSFDDRYVRLFLWNTRYDIISMGRGIAFPSISKKQLETFPIPLPPLAEQHRISAKVEELMTLCDQLETSVATVNANGNRLLESILQETLHDAA